MSNKRRATMTRAEVEQLNADWERARQIEALAVAAAQEEQDGDGDGR